VSRNVVRPKVDNPAMFVRVNLSTPGYCSVKIYNSAGELVRVLLEERRPLGLYQEIFWDGKNGEGEEVASGLYLIYYTNRYQTQMAKLILLR
jgi:flagellar hook assembly protein FlgD